ncbi:hypothetical protein V1477_003081, partial [Vespula maculifrons]
EEEEEGEGEGEEEEEEEEEEETSEKKKKKNGEVERSTQRCNPIAAINCSSVDRRSSILECISRANQPPRVSGRRVESRTTLSSPPSNPSPTPLSPTKVTQMQDADDRPRTLIPFVPKGMKNPMYIVNHRVIISDHTLESHEATTKSLGFDVKGRLVAFISIDSPLRNPGF